MVVAKAVASGQTNRKRSVQRELKPPGVSNASELVAWVNDRIYYDTYLRAIEISTYRRADLYDQGDQWLQRAYGASSDFYSSQWAPMRYDENDPLSLPFPVYNEGHGVMVNESARLEKAVFEPDVIPNVDNPKADIREGARKARQVLQSQLDEMRWPIERELGYNHLPRYGGWWLMSYWEQTWDDTVNVPVQGAMACPDGNCAAQNGGGEPFKLAKPDQGEDQCLWCSGNLQPHQPTMEEANGVDVRGEPMGQPQPLGRWRLKTASPYDVYAENQGIDIDLTDMREWVWVHVEHLDWIALRWPDRAHLVERENAAKLQHYHPIAGGVQIYGSGADRKLFSNHARVKEYNKKPWMQWQESQKDEQGRMVRPAGYRMNRGRSIVIGSRTVLYDGEFLLPSQTQPGQDVERCMAEYVPFERRDGGRTQRGFGLWELEFDAQDRVNEISSQSSAVNQRTALPILLHRKAHNLEHSGFRSGYPGVALAFETDSESPTAEPKLINNQTIDAGVWTERQIAQDYISRAGYLSEVERGGTPANVGAAAAIDLLGRNVAVIREPRVKRISDRLEQVWGHGLKLTAHLWIEPRRFSYEDEAGEQRWAMLRGLDLMGQTDVKIAAVAESSDIKKRAEIYDLVQLGVINPQDPHTARRIAASFSEEAQDLFHDDNLQEAGAQREFQAFIEGGVRPVIDPGVEDHQTHFHQHGRDVHSERFRDLLVAANWDAAAVIIAETWEYELEWTLMQYAMPKPQPMMTDLQTMIEQLWIQRLSQARIIPGPGMGPPNPDQMQAVQALIPVVQWRAHMEAHRLLGEQRSRMQMMGAPLMSAPGESAEGAEATGTPPASGGPPVEDTGDAAGVPTT